MRANSELYSRTAPLAGRRASLCPRPTVPIWSKPKDHIFDRSRVLHRYNLVRRIDAETFVFRDACERNYAGMKAGGGRLYKLWSNRALGMGGPAGAIRGYEVVVSSKLARTRGAPHATAVVMSRCRLGAGETCRCTVVMAGLEVETKESNRVASFTVNAHTARTTTNAQARWRQSYPRLES